MAGAAGLARLERSLWFYLAPLAPFFCATPRRLFPTISLLINLSPILQLLQLFSGNRFAGLQLVTVTAAQQRF